MVNVNDFPSKVGVSETMSPATIVIRKKIPEYNKKIIDLDHMLSYTLAKKFYERKKFTRYSLKGF